MNIALFPLFRVQRSLQTNNHLLSIKSQETSLRMSLEFEKLSTHNWSAPEVPSQKTQVEEDHTSQEGNLQVMYCKGQVYQEEAEFSLEELRAQRYYRSLNEKASQLKKLKQDLQRQIEEKQSLIQQRTSAADSQFVQVVDKESGSSIKRSSGSCDSVVKSELSVSSEREEERVLSRSSVRQEHDTSHGGSDVKPQRAAKPVTVFDENKLTNKTSSSSSRVSLKLPSLSLKAPRSRAELVSEKDASISRSEEAIVNGHWNKTLCRSPDDTCEFARAAQLASTPFAGVERTTASESAATESLSRAAPESSKAPSPEKKLSPILEISQEWGGASFATFSHSSTRLPQEPEPGPEPSRAEETPEEVTAPEDVCGVSVRSRLFHQADVTSFSNFQRRSGRLPDTSGDLCLDGELLVNCGEMETLKDFTLYFSSSSVLYLKVERSGVPWDFFIISQLRSRWSGDEPDAEVQVSCEVFEDGCRTLWRLPRGHTLQDLLEELHVSPMIVQFLELVKYFHSCGVVHGGLKPETLYYYQRGITALDFSSSVDLQLQNHITAARDLPSAQKYIQQGLLSPSASPYQVDLIGVAEVVHTLLFSRPLKVKQEDCCWGLDEGAGAQHSVPVKPLWKDFFRLTLNPEQKSSELLLSELISNLKNSCFE